MKILIVEDDRIIAYSLKLMITQFGYGVLDILDRGESVMGCVEKSMPDLIVMDIKLAGTMDGIEAAQAVHSRYPIPIIYLTGNSDSATIRRSECTKSAAYLMKPITKSMLRTAIEDVLGPAAAKS